MLTTAAPCIILQLLLTATDEQSKNSKKLEVAQGEILKFLQKSEISEKIWNSCKILKFLQNSEILQNLKFLRNFEISA